MSIFRLPDGLENTSEGYDYYNNHIEKKNKKDEDDDKDHSNYSINKDNPGAIYEALKLSDLIDETSDNIKKIFYFNKLKNLNEKTIVFNSILEYTKEKLHKSLLEDSELDYPLGLDIHSFYTPNEIKENDFIKNLSDSNWYNEFSLRTKGLAIKSNLLHSKSVGWNNILDYNLENIGRSVERLNKMIKNLIFKQINFIDLSNTPFEKGKQSFYKGITTYIIHGKEINSKEYISKIIFSINNKSNELYSFEKNGHINLNTKLDLENFIDKYEWAYIDVFFIPISYEVDNLLNTNIKNKDLMYFISNNNFISKAKQLFPNTELDILNDKLLMTNLLSIYNCIIYGLNFNSKEELDNYLNNHTISKNIYIYNLFKGNKNEFNNDYLFNKLDKIKRLKIDNNLDDSLLEGYCNIKEYDNILNESNNSSNDNVEFDYLDRVDYDSLF